MNFGNYLKKRRLEKSLTQSGLAKKIGVTQNYITYLESNERKPSNEVVKKLAQHLSVPADQLYLLANPEVKGFFIQKSPAKSSKLPIYLVELARNKKIREKYDITDGDINMLASIQAQGEISSMEDYVFLLMTIRQVFKD